MEVREIPISMLSENTGQIPDVPKNPRKITREKFDALCESIRKSPEMKVLDEIHVYPYGGRYVVISGNHRYKAYRKLGWVNVLCKVLPEDTPKEKLREYVMKENMHYAENDDALLNQWNQTLFDIKPVRLLSTKRGENNVNGQKIGMGRVLRGVEVINRLLKENGSQSKTHKNKTA